MRGNARDAVYALTDHRHPRELSKDEVAVLIDHGNALDAEIRTLLRGTGTVLNMGLIVLALIVTLTKDISRDVSFPILPTLLGIPAAWNFLNGSEIAVLAEVRDRIASRVNLHYGTPILLWRIASDVRRGSLGTNLLNYMLGIFYMVACTGSIWYSVARVNDETREPLGVWYPILTSFVTLITTALVLVTYREVTRDRKKTNENLDQVFGHTTRPESA